MRFERSTVARARCPGRHRPREQPELLQILSKIELAPPLLIADLGRARADLDRAVPELVIIGRRQLCSNNSWMHNLPVLAKGRFRCTALVSRAGAGRLGLPAQRRPRRIARGAQSIDVEVEVEISDDMMPGVISLPHGWGHDQSGTTHAGPGTPCAERTRSYASDLRWELTDPPSGGAHRWASHLHRQSLCVRSTEPSRWRCSGRS